MENFVNIGSVSLYESDESGGYVYSRLFRPQDYITVDDSINIRDNMNFGAAFDILGDHLVVGAPNEEPYVGGEVEWNNLNLGAVYIFDKTNGDLLQKIVPDNTPASWIEGSLAGTISKRHHFGYSVSCGPDYIVIGAPGYTANISSTEYRNSGRVYIYKHNGSEYELTMTITPSARIADNRFGDYVEAKDNAIIIANSPVFNSANNGSIRYIELETDRASATKDVTISNTHGSWEYSATFDSNRIAVGNFATDTVRIYLIENDIPRLTHTITDNLINSFEFGYDLEFDGDKILISCPNGYYKIGVVLRLQQVSNKYTLI